MRMKLAIASTYLAGALLVSFLVTRPFEVLLTHFIYDDFFYYLGVAEHLAREGRATFDGTAPTNGFHPLWMIVSTVAQWIGGRNAAIRIVLVIGATLHLAQSWALFRLLRTLGTSRPVAHGGALFYLFNYRLIAWNLCGLEPPLQGLLFLLTLTAIARQNVVPDFLETSERFFRKSQGLRFAGLGVMLGLVALARLDGLLFAGLAVAFIAPTSRRGAVTMAIVCGGVLVPWFLWSLAQSGVWLPNSRTALAIWSFDPPRFDRSLAEQIYWLHQRIFSAAWWLSDSANLLGLWPFVSPTHPKVGGAIALVSSFALAAFLWRTRAREGFAFRIFVFGFGLAQLAYYVFFARAEIRYVMPWILAQLILWLWSASEIVKQKPSWRLHALALWIALFSSSTFAGVAAWRSHQGMAHTHAAHEPLLRASEWIRAHSGASDVVGSWNSGVVGYFAERTVVNLDGVINDDAIQPLRDRQLADYLAKRDVRYLVDLESEIEKFMNDFSGDPEWKNRWEVVKTIGPVEIRRQVGASAN